MNIVLRRRPEDRLLELGGGAAPLVYPACLGGPDVHVDVRVCHLPDGRRCVDFPADLNEPLPLKDEEFDGAVAKYALEHISWRNLPALLKEVYRILKPDGLLVLILPNTQAQLEYISNGGAAAHKDGEFVEASRILYGDQDYPANSHKVYLSPGLITQLLTAAGFESVTVTSYGELATDMVVETHKTNVLGTNVKRNLQQVEEDPTPTVIIPAAPQPLTRPRLSTPVERAARFGRAYWDNYQNRGMWAWDYPTNEVVARKLLEKKPEGVLELGCGRGYILKRIEDAGVACRGLDISQHCWLTRATDAVTEHDLCVTPLPVADNAYDLCFSLCLLEHIEEDYLPHLFAEMERTCRRGLHAIDFNAKVEDDPTRVTRRPRGWWVERLPRGHDILDKAELERGELPATCAKGDGKVKVNLGCAWTMFHHGWINLDIIDAVQFAALHGYQFRRGDLLNGLPFKTEEVDLLLLSHVLEHFSYDDGRRFLRECRRVCKPRGALRITVPDAAVLMSLYCGAMEHNGDLSFTGPFACSLRDLGEVNAGCAEAKTAAAKLQAVLWDGHKAVYDLDTLCNLLVEAGWEPYPARFRQAGCEASKQILRETVDTHPALSLYVDAVPVTG